MGHQRRNRVVWVVVLMTLLLGGLPGAARAMGEPINITRRITTPRFILGGQDLRVPGYAMNDMPGAPRLPVNGTVVELPLSGDWKLEVRTVGSRTLAQRPAIPAVPVPDLSLLGPESWTRRADLPAAVPTVDRPYPAIYQANAFYPASPAVAGDVQWQRGRRLLAVRVFPFQYNPVTREVRYHPEVEITVRVTPAESSDGFSRSTAAVTEVSAASGALRIRTRARGLYRLTYDDLLAAGVPLDTVDPRSFFMTYLGQPIRIQVLGETDAAFDPGDLVIFYAEPYQGRRYMVENVYRFFWRQTPASPLTRMGARTVASTGAEPVVNAITQTLHIEFDRAYYNDYPLPQDADHFFDNPIYPFSSSPVVTRTYTLALDDPVTTGNVSLRSQLYGGSDQAPAPDQSVAVWLNNHLADTWQWDGRTGFVGAASAPAAALSPTSNAVKLEAALSQLPGLGEYWVYPDWVEVSYPALPDAELDRINIEGIDVIGASAQITVTGFTTGTVAVYDVRRPGQPVQLLATEAISDGVRYALHFWDAWGEDEPAAGYALTTADALLAPAAVEFDAPSTLRTATVQADYIAVVHRSLWDAIQPLLDRRASQGLRVAKVDVQDIYDEFNAGLVDPEAIREFLTYAYDSWNLSQEPPRYVLLVGDGHYDFKFVTGTKLPNLIPPYLINVDPFQGEAAADNRYVSVDGPDDYLPDMAIGRIPAISPADVTAIVSKTLTYEDPVQTPDGDWQSRAVYVADDYADSAGNFHALSDEVRTNWLPPSYETRRVYYRMDAAHDTGGEMRTAIKSEFNQGALYLQWFGHANVIRWGSVSMYNIYDPPTLSPNNWMPFTVHFACWSGMFSMPNIAYGNGQSLAEVMVAAEGRSSVVDLAPSGMHVGGALLTLNEGLTLALFRDRIRPAGDAVNAAKLYYFANSAAWHDVIDTEIFFGDPALKLRVPATPPTVPQVDIAAKGTNASLNWPHELDSAQYEVWRDTAPYFDPAADAGGGILVSTVDAGFVSRGASFTFEDAGATPPPSVQIIGDPAANYFWVLRSRNSDGVSGLSNRVGEFDFSLTPGTE